jgi:PAS domain S-box-containing protein
MTSTGPGKARADAVAIVQADTSGTICLWSKGAEALLGYTAEQAIGRKVDVLVPEQYRDAHWKGFHGAMARGALEGNEPFIVPAICADGQVRHLAGRLLLLRDAYGKSVGALAMFVPEDTSPSAPELYRV